MTIWQVLGLGVALPGAVMFAVEVTFADPKWRPLPALLGVLVCVGLVVYDFQQPGPSPWPRVAAAALSGTWLNSFLRIRKRVV